MNIRYIFLALGLLLLCVTGIKAADTGILTVNIDGLRDDQGKVMLAVFASQEGFPNDASKAYKTYALPINGGKASVMITDLPFGTYAISLFQDKNGNGKLDRSFFGIPLEGYGFSNNPPKSKRQPKFVDAQFNFEGSGSTMQIKLIYY